MSDFSFYSIYFSIFSPLVLYVFLYFQVLYNNDQEKVSIYFKKKDWKPSYQ